MHLYHKRRTLADICKQAAAKLTHAQSIAEQQALMEAMQAKGPDSGFALLRECIAAETLCESNDFAPFKNTCRAIIKVKRQEFSI